MLQKIDGKIPARWNTDTVLQRVGGHKYIYKVLAHWNTAVQILDSKILAYWDTAPSERVWAYLATFVPLLGLIVTIAGTL